jgi:CO dehydrogenase/acetyl-CoA synthase epsilon subunit
MGMIRHEAVEIMVETVNNYNRNLMATSKLSQEDIEKGIDAQYPALAHMMGLIYDDLETNGAFK